jgi:hypothetical protein
MMDGRWTVLTPITEAEEALLAFFSDGGRDERCCSRVTLAIGCPISPISLRHSDRRHPFGSSCLRLY